MVAVYGSTAGLFFGLAALCWTVYLQRRERASFGVAIVCLVLGGTALAIALDPGLLPWLAPLTPLSLIASWWLTGQRRTSHR